MIRHILFWKFTDQVKAEHREAEALAFLQNSVATMDGHIDGLLRARSAQIPSSETMISSSTLSLQTSPP
ncbi:MAG: hypothetical protein V8S27_03095 [Lachnospiraceae bacterium]